MNHTMVSTSSYVTLSALPSPAAWRMSFERRTSGFILTESLRKLIALSKWDVGIEDCLHIEFEYSKSKYHLKDVIVGRIYFLLVRLKIKHMELSIIRRETTGVAPNQYNESETLVRFEVSALYVTYCACSCRLTRSLDYGWLAIKR